VPDPSKRFATLVLTAGILVLLLAIVLGEGMGQNVMRNVNEGNLASIPVAITPNPQPSSVPYGPGWEQPDALAAAPDPRFPDPRVPPVPLPTFVPRPTVGPKPTATPDTAIPIWRRAQPLPTTPPGDRSLIPQSNVTPAPQPSATLIPGPSPKPPLHP
jgi:hypothetical protein